MKIGLFTICFFIFTIGITAQSTVTGTLLHEGKARAYRIHLPPNHSKEIALPLVFNFHGYTSNSIEQEFYSGMNQVADTARFIVCYPDGINNAWNVGWAFGSTADDVGFTAAMIDEFYVKYGIDKSRVYSSGMSNGGFMSYTLACQLNDRIAAIASVTGSMIPNGINTCKPNRPVPVMEIHGTADGTVSYTGTPLIAAPIASVLKFWQENNGCDQSPIIAQVPNINTTDNTTAEKWTYTSCKDGSQLIHFKVNGGGHTWPGAFINIGVTSLDFNASVEIWKFFRQFRVNQTTFLEENIASPLAEIYPSPFIDDLQLTTREDARVMVRDIQGKTVFTQSLLSGNHTIDADSWSPGMYFVTVKAGQKVITKKIIKI
jgi:polyhydroxybutyrate depolymerase